MGATALFALTSCLMLASIEASRYGILTNARATASAQAGLTADGTSPLTDFLEKFVSNRTFCTEAQDKVLNNGTSETESQKETTFTLSWVREGLDFELNITTVNRQTNYKLSPNGTRVGAGQILDRVIRETCHFGVRSSTGIPTGLCFNAKPDGTPEQLTSSSFTPTAAFGLELSNNGTTLTWYERPATPYVDVIGTDKVGLFEVTTAFTTSVDGNNITNVTLDDTAKFWDYDPITAKRTNETDRPDEVWSECAKGTVVARPGGKLHTPQAGDTWAPWGRQRVFQFLKDRINGKKFSVPSKGEIITLDDGLKVERARSFTSEYSKLTKTYDGFWYLVSHESRQSDHVLDASGKRVQGAAAASPPKVQKTQLRCEYAVRRTWTVQGVCWPLAREEGLPFIAHSSQLSLVNASTLSEVFSTLLPYEDLIGIGGAVEPGFQERKHFFNVKPDGTTSLQYAPLVTYIVETVPPFSRAIDATLAPSTAVAQPRRLRR